MFRLFSNILLAHMPNNDDLTVSSVCCNYQKVILNDLHCSHIQNFPLLLLLDVKLARNQWFTVWAGTAWWTVHWTVQAIGSTWQPGVLCVCCRYSGQRLWSCRYLQQYDTHLSHLFVYCSFCQLHFCAENVTMQLVENFLFLMQWCSGKVEASSRNGMRPVKTCHLSPEALFWNKWSKKTEGDLANPVILKNGHWMVL